MAKRKNGNGNGNGKRLATQQSVDQALASLRLSGKQKES
jgi:hypothetical protein